MSEEENSIEIVRDSGDTALDISAFVASAVPWVGGPVSNVLAGISTGRKFKRVAEVLEGFAEDLRNFRSDVSEQYVKTEDFEELLEETLRRVAAERTEEKRRVYRKFLVQSVQEPGVPYDELLRVLRTLEGIQPAHLRVLVALDSEPNENAYAISGSPLQTLSTRLPELPREAIEDLVAQLNDLRVASLTSLKTMMTPRGASDLRHSITPLGRSLMRSVKGGDAPAA